MVNMVDALLKLARIAELDALYKRLPRGVGHNADAPASVEYDHVTQ